MSSTYEHLGKNSEAEALISETINRRERDEPHYDVATGCMFALHSAGLVVVRRDEWEAATQLVQAVRAVAT